MDSTRSAHSSPCSLCGQSDEDMDTWLGICPRCLAQAARTEEEERQKAEPNLPHVEGYRLRRPIGRGGMGSVYEAERESDGLQVALKLITSEMAEEARFREQFRREAEALRVLDDHPGVVRRLDSGEEDGRPWLAMEFVDGPDLRQVLRRGPLPVARALEIATEVGAALASAHAAGIIHRDIKPANVLLDPEGRVKVADFGMARPHRSDNTVSDPLTLVAAAAGHYSAPELECRGAGDARGDVYSLGALLYHLRTGHAPRAAYRPARRERPDAGISRGVDRIIARSLQTDPEQRFPTMEDLLAALERERRRLLTAPIRARQRRWWLSGGLMAALLLGAWWMVRERNRKGAVPTAVLERLAPTPEDWVPQRWVNSLEMPFVGVPGLEVLVCVWETRIRDYAAFDDRKGTLPSREWVRETGFAFSLDKPCYSLREGEFKAAGHSWTAPGFDVTSQHPVCGVSLFDAKAFCTWLTWRERRSGAIGLDQAYRLPTDAEWSAAAGLQVEPGETPEERHDSWPKGVHAWLWGGNWPAPNEDFNVAGDEVLGPDWHPGWIFTPRHDPWPYTAPVNAGRPSSLGLHHLTGNVAEWTESLYTADPKLRLYSIRGGSWMDASREGVSLNGRDKDAPDMRITTRGFRIVFQPAHAAGWRYGTDAGKEP